MPQPSAQSTFRPEVNQELRWIKEHSVESCIGEASSPPKLFTPTPAIREHFTYSRLLTILEKLFDETECPRLAHRILNQGHDPHLLVFLILLQCGVPQCIEDFLQDDELSDKHLPFHSATQFPVDIDFKAFDDNQRPFVSPVLQPNPGFKKVHSNRILPVEQREVLKTRDSPAAAEISRIKVHPDYDRLEQLAEVHHPHVYILKSYRGPDGKRKFDVEVQGYLSTLKSGGPINSLTKFYGGIIYQEEHHLILEYADQGNWEEYMQRVEPPRRASDISSLWQSHLEVAQVLHRVHVEGGCHQDVNPRNLLVKRKPHGNIYDVYIKLGDFNRYHKVLGSAGTVYARDMYGTKRYGAPETYRPDQFAQNTILHVPQNVDVWSLGCIWSEVAVWFADGPNGVKRYCDNRQQEVKTLDMEDIACFHDTAKMLVCVKDVLQNMTSMASTEDDLSAQICQGLIPHMLHSDGQHRLKSSDMLSRTQAILNRRTSQSVNAFNLPQRTLEPGIELDFQGLNLRRTDTAPGSSGGRFNRRPVYMDSPPLGATGVTNTVESPRQMTFAGDERDSFDHRSRQEKRPLPAPAFTTPVLPSHSRPWQGKSRGQDYSFEPDELPDYRRSSTTRMPRSGTSAGERANCAPPQDVVDPAPRYTPSEQAQYPSHFRNDSRMQEGPQHGPHASPAEGKRPVRRMEVPTARVWMEKKKRGNSDAYLDGWDEVRKQLKARDHEFILDDCYSSGEHWESMCYILELLSFMVQYDDPDGIVLRFSNSDDMSQSRDPQKLKACADGVTPRGSKCFGDTLEKVLNDYRQKLDYHAHARLTRRVDDVRPLSIYVLTNGENLGSPAVPIVELVTRLSELKCPGKHVGVQFISFGQNQVWIESLRQMDVMSQTWNLPEDIVDTEPSNGDVYKMLLGAIDRKYDDAS